MASEFNPSASFSSVACSLLNPSIPVPRLQLIRPSSVAQPDSLQLMPIQAKKTPGELRTPGSWGASGEEKPEDSGVAVTWIVLLLSEFLLCGMMNISSF